MKNRLFFVIVGLLLSALSFGQALDLPVNFENATSGYYGLTDFGGNYSQVIVDPTNASNHVAQTIKGTGAELWAGTTVGGSVGFASPIPFAVGATSMTVRVYSPVSGIPVRLKVEDANNPTISVETEATTTVAASWETLTFNFSNQATGTAALNIANTYNKASIFFNFGTTGAQAGEQTYYWDDMEFVPAPPPYTLDLPVNFENTTANYYNLTDFGGSVSQIVVDPANASNHVAQTIKGLGAELWAGTTVGGSVGFASPIPFAAGATSMTVRVYSPVSGIPVRLKVEDASNPTITVETEATTTVAASWETLTFNFSNQATGTAALNMANTYNKANIFFNFGTTGAQAGEQTYYWDDMEFVTVTPPATLNLPVDFENTTANFYGLTDFGGNASQIIIDPSDASNHVVQTLKPETAELWAGTTVGGATGFETPIPFAAGSTTITVRVWAPAVGIHVRLKVEDANNPAISVETEAITTVAAGWETLSFNFANQASGTASINYANSYNKASIFFNFGTTGAQAGAQTFYWDDMIFVPGPPPTTLNLPVTFENTSANFYNLIDFGGNSSQIVVDPTNASNHVVQTLKTGTAELWAGTTVGGTTGFDTPIPFASGSTIMTVRVWAPAAGIPVRLKVESASNGAISVETEAITTLASAWQTLSFNFANQATGTAPLNLANSYNKASIFFNFGTTGAQAGPLTFYWDDIVLAPAPLNLPVTFENTTANFYNLVDFGGNASQIVVDPDNASNHVVQTLKTGSAELWAGTTIGGTTGFATPIPFTTGATSMTVRVWAPATGIHVRLKVESATNGAISVETEAITTVAAAWETLTFNFSNQATGTAALNLSNSYNKASIFFNFGTTGAQAGAQTFYWDDMQFVSGPPPATLDLPVNFENTTTNFYNLIDFGGNVSQIVIDPANTSNHVAQTLKTGSAELWAGTTVGGTVGFSNPVPFAPGLTSMTVRVWAPAIGLPVRLKVEAASNGAISVETEAITTVANAWETLTFNFANQAPGTAALNFANSYNKASIFFNFGTTGAQSGAQTFFWDDMTFVEAPPPPSFNLPVTFENTTENYYNLTDFGGNASQVVVDPTNSSNRVAQTIKTAGAELWAGTTVGGTIGFTSSIPFTIVSTSMNVRVWSPAAGIPVRLKVESSLNPAITVETEAVTTFASAWQTLTFNFANQAPGTAALNLANSYNKASIFFNFGTTGAQAGAQTYYWDDMQFGTPVCNAVSTMSATEIDATTWQFQATGIANPALYSYSWNFGDGTVQTVSGTATINHTYTSNGTYTVSLVVTEIANANCSASSTQAIYVVGPHPGWNYTTTTSSHSITIPASASISVEGVPVVAGDYLGLFYHDENNNLACAGYVMVTGSALTMVAWGDNASTTPAKEGFATGETFIWKIWKAATNTDYTATAVYQPLSAGFTHTNTFASNGLSGISSLSFVTIVTQNISFNLNWNLFSTYIIPTNPAISSVMSPIAGQFYVVKNGSGAIYWPLFGINGIGNLVLGQAYQIKTTTATVLPVSGQMCNAPSVAINLPTNWSLLGYLYPVNHTIASMLAPIYSQIVIVKNYNGQVYWPLFNINTIVNMVPGQGYQIKLNGAAVFHYPAVSAPAKDFVSEAAPMHFTGTVQTGSNMTIGLPAESLEDILNLGDEVAVFSANGQMVGSSVFTGSNIAIAAWGDDEYSTGKDGLTQNERFEFRIWKANSAEELPLRVTEWVEGSNSFVDNGLAIAGKVQMVEAGLGFELAQNMPNPFRNETVIRFSLPEAAPVMLEVFNMLGVKVMTVDMGSWVSGNHSYTFHGESLAPGSYQFRISNGQQAAAKQFTIIR